ncbi:hypothetical protein [Streptomyces torulosus]|uniref:hypothetical protein n=1 Tax=Streptomyces torulosus TaxID=68276 RepID=UPI000ADDEA87|nr:hypothetical protein [Streptomyces torulosus]
MGRGVFRRWQRDGTWQQIFTTLQARADAKDLITWDINVDPTIARAHHHAAGAAAQAREPAAGSPSASCSVRSVWPVAS